LINQKYALKCDGCNICLFKEFLLGTRMTINDDMNGGTSNNNAIANCQV
jgi:hypothetical protein